MDRLHYAQFLLIALSLFLGAWAVAGVQGAYNQDNPNLTEAVNGILEEQANQKEINSLVLEAVADQTARSVQNTDRIIDLENYDNTITQEIGKINSKVKDVLPASSVLDEGQSTQSTLPSLTLKMDQSEFVRGNTVIFYGMAKPNDPVILTIKLPDRDLESIGVSKNQILDGQWSANFTLRLDDALGIWQVYARQGATDQTKTLSFTVE